MPWLFTFLFEVLQEWFLAFLSGGFTDFLDNIFGV